MLMWNLPLSRRQDFHRQLTEALYSCEELIPRLGCADTGRSTGHDEITRFQGVVLREERDLFGHAPNHLVDIRVLAKLAVYLEPELAFFRVPALRGGGNGPKLSGLVEILAQSPGPALVFSHLLKTNSIFMTRGLYKGVKELEREPTGRAPTKGAYFPMNRRS